MDGLANAPSIDGDLKAAESSSSLAMKALRGGPRRFFSSAILGLGWLDRITAILGRPWKKQELWKRSGGWRLISWADSRHLAQALDEVAG